MTTPIPYSIDDKDFDDAALWAVIDSAEATHSSTKFRKQPLSIKYPNLQSPANPISHNSPPPKVPKNPNKRRAYHNNHFCSNTDSYSRPHKMGTPCVSEVSESTSPLALVRTPVTNTSAKQFSPESYLSPQIEKLGAPEFNEGLEASPGSFVRGGEKEVMRHCLNGRFPSVSLFKDYQNAAIAILEKSDFTMISGNPFIKKSGWRKISFYFNISYEIKDRTIEFDDNRNVQRAEFVVRAHMQGGRFSDGWGSCERREKRFLKPNHDIPSTAETRAKNKACQDLLGIGEYRPGLSHFPQ